MEVLIDQKAGFGDIFFCQKIAVKLMELGHTVYWDVIPEYQYIRNYIQNGIVWHIDQDKLSKVRTLNLDQSTRYFSFNPRSELNNQIMQTKYRYANEQFSTGGWENWQDYIKITRNPDKEKALERRLLKDVPSKFAVTSNHFATDYRGLNKHIESKLPIVEIIKIPSVHIFSWCGIIEKASEIRIPDSSFPYLVEILNTTDNLHMYSRNAEKNIRTKPIWGKKWEFIDNWGLIE